jgi:hypothetical protein
MEDSLKALEVYMNPTDPQKKKGKLIIMLDVDVVRPEGVMRETGLDPMLQTFGVEITKERIVSYGNPPAQRVIVIANPEARSSNPVAAALGDEMLVMLDVRPVRNKPAAPNRPGAMPYRADPILVAMASNIAPLIWVESDLSRDPNDLVEELRKDKNKAEGKGFTRGGVPVAVAVSEAGPPDRNNPHAFMQPSTEGTPRLLAFGNAAFVSDSSLQSRQGPRRATGYPNYDVFESSLAWLRERPQSIGLDPKDRKIYQLEPNANLMRMWFLPIGLMMVTVLALGLGVWVVRRR